MRTKVKMKNHRSDSIQTINRITSNTIRIILINGQTWRYQRINPETLVTKSAIVTYQKYSQTRWRAQPGFWHNPALIQICSQMFRCIWRHLKQIRLRCSKMDMDHNIRRNQNSSKMWPNSLESNVRKKGCKNSVNSMIVINMSAKMSNF